MVPVLMRFIRGQMRRSRQAGLSVPQFRALVYLSVHEDTSLSAMAEHLGLSLPTASRMVQLLVQRGLVERQEHAEDRRRVALSLTTRGSRVYRTALNATEVALASSLRTLRPQRLARLSEAMQTLNELFSQG